VDAAPDDARLQKLLADVAATPPYPGLRPFRPDEQRFFKGRKAQIEEITARLTTEKCVVVHGGSGSGKPSLVLAGVIPALRLQSIPDRGDFWRVAICTPGQAPVGNLVAALDTVLAPDPTGDRVERIHDVLVGGDGLGGFLPAFRQEIPLEEGVSRAVLDKANLLVLVDQFEELFREENHGNPEVAWLAGLVVDAWRHRERYEGLYLVLTMRSDDLHRCAEFTEFPNMINAAGYLTRRLEEKELREAIVAPVRPLLIRARLLAAGGPTGEADLRPFDVEVVTRLLDAAEEIAADPDHLPLLQHLLAVLWRTALRRWRDDGVGPDAEPRVELGDLARALGLAGWDKAEAARRAWESRQHDRGRDRLAGKGWLLRRGLEHVADTLYRGLNPPDQRIARAAFCLMGVVDDRGSFKRRWTTLGEIREVAGAPALTLADPALHSFMDPDPFVRTEAEAKAETEKSLDVSHESLMRNWESLGDWLRRNREDGEALLDVRQAYLERGDQWPASWLAANAPKVLGWVNPPSRPSLGPRPRAPGPRPQPSLGRALQGERGGPPGGRGARRRPCRHRAAVRGADGVRARQQDAPRLPHPDAGAALRLRRVHSPGRAWRLRARRELARGRQVLQAGGAGLQRLLAGGCQRSAQLRRSALRAADPRRARAGASATRADDDEGAGQQGRVALLG
jgi:hypothetical protein